MMVSPAILMALSLGVVLLGAGISLAWAIKKNII